MNAGEELALEAKRAFAEAGSAVGDGPLHGFILRAGVADRTSLEPSAGEPERLEITGLFTSFTMSDRMAGPIADNEVKLRLDATGVRPVNSDDLEINGESYEIISVEPYQPAGTPIYYTVRARRS